MKKIKELLIVLPIIIIISSCNTIKNIEVTNNKKQNVINVFEKIKTTVEENNNPTSKTYKVMKYTTCDTQKENEFHNMNLAMSSINNITIKCGEEFSFNNIVGRRTEEKGYKNAGVIYRDSKGNSYKGLGIGGGICQVSSTLYMACRELNLEILERNPHSSNVEYCLPEDEAMINWGTSDFRFKNTLNEDITIKMYFESIDEDVSKQKLICEIW